MLLALCLALSTALASEMKLALCALDLFLHSLHPDHCNLAIQGLQSIL
jgi:hypothetical protein